MYDRLSTYIIYPHTMKGDQTDSPEKQVMIKKEKVKEVEAEKRYVDMDHLNSLYKNGVNKQQMRREVMVKKL